MTAKAAAPTTIAFDFAMPPLASTAGSPDQKPATLAPVTPEELHEAMALPAPPAVSEAVVGEPVRSLAEAADGLKKKRRSKTAQPATDVSADAADTATAIPSRRRKQSEVVMTVPTFVEPEFANKTVELHASVKIVIKDGFYSGPYESGVVYMTTQMGVEIEGRMPYKDIKGLFRVSWVADMQAEHLTVLSETYTVYGDTGFVQVNKAQFEALDGKLSKAVTRSYTYLDMADKKRGYTFPSPGFPSYEEIEEYRYQHSGLQRRQADPPAPIMEAGADD